MNPCCIATSVTVVCAALVSRSYVRPEQRVEATFKFMPGKIYGGKVESVLQAIATGQVQLRNGSHAKGD